MTAPILDAFDTTGVAVVHGALTHDEVSALGARYESWITDPGLSTTDVASLRLGPAMRTAMLYWPDSAWLRSAAWLPRLADLGRAALGEQQVRFFNASLFAKPPGCEVGVPWHQDLTYYPLAGTSMVTLWVSLDHSIAGAGALEYVLDSHLLRRQVAPSRFRGSTDETGSDRERQINEIVDSGIRRSWDLSPGDVALHHGLVWHRSTENRAVTRRRGLAIRFIGEEVVHDVAAGVTTIPGIIDNRLGPAHYPALPPAVDAQRDASHK